MNVFEAIKEMSMDELSEFIFRVAKRYDVLDDGFCRHNCEDYDDMKCVNNLDCCYYRRDRLYGCKTFLQTDIEMIRSLVYEK